MILEAGCNAKLEAHAIHHHKPAARESGDPVGKQDPSSHLGSVRLNKWEKKLEVESDRHIQQVYARYSCQNDQQRC